MSTKLKTVQIDTRPFDVYVDDEGQFFTRWQGDNIFAPSLKTLEEKLRKTVRAAGRIAVPVSRISDTWHSETPTITHIVLTGVHAGNGNVLYREEGENTVEQIRSFDDEIYQRLTESDIAQFHTLKQAVRTAEEALDTWKTAHKVNPRSLMEQAQQELTTK